MNDINKMFRELYQNFNDRRIDRVISKMTNDVQWANGMEGGYVYVHKEVQNYWKRQFTIVSSNVTPLEITEKDGVVKIKVRQVVHHLNGKMLADEIVYHYFHLKENKIEKFLIGGKTGNSA
jgi:hypothetical protein